MSDHAAGNEIEESSADFIVHPVGFVKNDIKEPFLKSGDEGIRMQGPLKDMINGIHKVKKGLSEIIITHGQTEILDEVEKYSHIIVLYWAHKVPANSRSLTKIHPMGRKDIPLKGIFATCSPARPNPILITVARLCEVKDNVLTVAGLDAIDGSPVLDIKPYVGEQFPHEDVVIADWMKQLMEEIDEKNAKE